MILCCANAIPMLLELVQKKEDFSYFKSQKSLKSLGRELLYFDMNVDDRSSKSSKTRNRLIAITSPVGSFMLKQPLKFTSARIMALKKEAAITKLLYENKHLRKYLPKSFGFDEINCIFFREWWKDVNAVGSLLRGKPAFDDGFLLIIEKIAECLLTFHSELPKLHKKLVPISPLFESTFPSPLLTYNPDLKPFYRMGNSQLTLLYDNYLSEDGKEKLVKKISLLSVEWTKHSKTIIHGDVKLDNILFNEKQSHVFLIDWELAMYGDMAWDVSGILYELIFIFFDHARITTFYDNIKIWFLPFWRIYSTALTEKADYISFQRRLIAYSGIRIIDLLKRTKMDKSTIRGESLLELGESMVIESDYFTNIFS